MLAREKKGCQVDKYAYSQWPDMVYCVKKSVQEDNYGWLSA